MNSNSGVFIIFIFYNRYKQLNKKQMKNKKLLLAYFFVIFCALGLSSQNSYNLQFNENNKVNKDPVRNVTYNTDYLDIQYQVYNALIKEIQVKGIDYQFINMEGFGHMMQPGKPAVPSRTDIVALHNDVDYKLKIIKKKYKEFDGYNIHPALKPARDTEGSPEPEFMIDKEVYSTNAFFPENIAEVVEIQKIRGMPLAFIQFNPVQFNPVTKKIRVYTEVEYSIETGNKESFQDIGSSNTNHFTTLLKRMVINDKHIPNAVNNTGQKSIDDVNYIIVTHDEYLAAADELAAWKMQLGYNVEIIAGTNWTSENIKSEIAYRYDVYEPKPDYLLIIGDHTGDFAVPGEMHAVDGEPFATDLYYACMDGDYDYIPDMAFGRISVSSVQEANVVVQKIINYEKNPVTDPDFYTNGLNCAQYQDDDNNGYADRRFCHTSEDVRDYLIDSIGYNIERIYYTDSQHDVTNLHYNYGYYSNGELLPAELRTPSFNWNGGSSEITSAINAGKFFVLHRDHGYSGGSGWAHPYYTTSSMNSLSNGDLLPVIFSINCHTGEYQLDNCFAEKLVRMENKGAVGVVAAAYYSYSGYNDAFVAGMFDAMWAEPGLTFQFGSGGTNNPPPSGPPTSVRTMADVISLGLARMTETWGVSQYSYELFHWFGDPAMKMWTSNPHDSLITANYNTEIDCEESAFLIDNCNVDSAMITLLQDNQLIGRGILMQNSLSLDYNLVNDSPVTMTLSKENHKPLTAQLTVTGTCIYPPGIETGIVEDISYNQANISAEIITDNGGDITASGIVLGANPNPEIGQNSVSVVETDPLVSNGIFTVTALGLEGYTPYYYRAFATNASGTSYGDVYDFTTICSPVYEYPYTCGFEDENQFECWSQEYISGDNIDWMLGTGDNSNSTSPYSGLQNILFYDGEVGEDKTLFITPIIDFSGYGQAILSFYHLQESFINNNSELRVFYKNTIDGDWNLLAEYTEPTDGWTERTILLDDLSETFFIGFEGNALVGDGIAIDDVELSTSVNITDHAKGKEIKVFPNPASNTFYIKNSTGEDIEELEIFDMMGKSIMNKRELPTSPTINIENLGNGLYYLKIKTKTRSMNLKLVVE